MTVSDGCGDTHGGVNSVDSGRGGCGSSCGPSFLTLKIHAVSAMAYSYLGSFKPMVQTVLARCHIPRGPPNSTNTGDIRILPFHFYLI